MKKRIVAIALVLMLAVSILPATALADSGIYVSVGGKYFTQANQTINVGGGTATLQYIDYMNFKLILNNVNITSFVKNFSNNGVDYYAGILYLDESKMGTMVVEFQGNNSITAPAHGSNAVYEGIFGTGRMIFRGDNLSINGVDVGLEAGTTFSTEGSECEVFFGNKNLTINATNTDVYCEWLEIGSCNCTFNSTGYNCVTTSYKFTTNKSTQLKLNLTPDVNKGYGNPVAMMCTNSCVVFGSLNINVNLDASEYKGAEEITAFGVYADAIWFDSNRQYVNVNLKSDGNAAAVGIYCDILNVQSEKEYPLLSSKVSISGEHKESSAILCETSACFSGKAEAVITGASEYDCAYECYGNTAIRNNIFYAQTDCKNALYGAVYSAGDFSAWNPIFTPANGVKQNIGGEEAGIIIADADGNPADCVVIAADGNPFRDIYDQIDAFKTSILWANDMKITSGVTPVEFRPTAACTRGQIVTFLWRAMGSPEPALTCNPFVDVKETSPYYKAILWAVEQGITMGVDATHFKPSNPCTRGQVVTFLWRAMGSPESGISENSFVDVKETSPYYKAILWAVEQGITNGFDATHFKPSNPCTRAQIVTFLYRGFEGQEISRKISDYRFALGEEPNADNKKRIYVKRDNNFNQGVTWNYTPVNLYLTFDITTNRGTRTEEEMYTLYLPMSIVEGEKPLLDENWAYIVGTYGNKIVFNYTTNNKEAVFAWFDCADMSSKRGYTTDETVVIANKVIYFYGEMFGVADMDTGKLGTNHYYYLDMTVRDDAIYFVYYYANDYLAVYKLTPENMVKEELLRCSKSSSVVFDETGYNVTDNVDGDEVTTHYDFP